MIDPTEPDPRTVKMLERLVAFPTVSTESNLDLIAEVEAGLRKNGFETRRFPDPAGRKVGLMARLGTGPGGIMLSAHCDVVPASGQDWTRPPFRMTREGERLYGRGTTDMKGFLAAMLSMAGRAATARLRRPLILAISYDEELGCRGIRQMLPHIEALHWLPALCIVGEPTGMRPAIGHKGKAAFRVTCRGEAGHSARAPLHVNAIHLAADLVAALRSLQAEYAASGSQDPAYDIPCSTIHVGRIGGGVALNIVPEEASLEFELRHLPGDSLEAFRTRLERAVEQVIAAHPGPRTALTVEMTNDYPGLEVADDHAAVRRILEFTESETTTKVGYGTEAGYFHRLGIPTVVCGPGDMDAQGHRADEYLDCAQLAACDRMLDRVLDDLCQCRPDGSAA